MAAYATKLAELFASEALRIYYAESVAEKITNQDYEGQLRGRSSVLNILTFGALAVKNYTGSNLTVDDVTESNGQLVTDQQKAFYFRIKSLDQFKSWVSNPEGTLLAQTANELKKTIDTYVLGLYTKVAAGNRIGTDYVTGTVTVTAVTGATVGVGTTFTAAMVGRGFKATGHTKWYRVKTFTDATNIVIEDDLDDTATAYTGGAIAGATYTIEAATAIQITKSNVYQYMSQLVQKLADAEVPAEDNFIVVPPYIASMIRQAPEYTPAVATAYDEVVRRGLVTQILGLTVYQSPRVVGDSVTGWHMLGGHRSGITFAMGFVENGIEDLIGNFGKAYKSLNVYGAKVVDERRKALVELFGKA